MRTTRSASVAGLSALFLVLGVVVALPAFAAGCTLADGGVTMNVTASGATKIKRLESADPLLDDTIVVSDGDDQDDCPSGTGNEHTVFDINSINVTGAGPLTIDLSGGDFAPGFTTESGTDEIEFYLANTVVLIIQGTDAVDDWAFGLSAEPTNASSPKGIGLNSDSDPDIVSGTPTTTTTLSVASVTANGAGANDTFEQVSKATETLNGDSGIDTVDYSSRTGNLLISVGGGANDGEQIPANPAENDDVDADIETVVGGSGVDSITVLPTVPLLKYKLEGGAGDDTLTAGEARDTLLGGADDDELNAGGGRDLLNGGAGDDTENGELGNDTFDQESTTNGSDTLNGGEAPVGDPPDVDAVKYNLRALAVTVTIGAGGANDGCTAAACTTAENDNVGSDIESVYGGKGADTLTAGASKARFSAGAGNDAVNGADGNDRLLGGAGDDIIKGGKGDDYLSGDADKDTLTGGDDKDTLLGGTGNDKMNGEAGIDRLSGSSGNDELWGDGLKPAVKDTLVGGSQTGTTGDLCQRDLKDLLSGCEGRATGVAPVS